MVHAYLNLMKWKHMFCLSRLATKWSDRGTSPAAKRKDRISARCVLPRFRFGFLCDSATRARNNLRRALGAWRRFPGAIVAEFRFFRSRILSVYFQITKPLLSFLIINHHECNTSVIIIEQWFSLKLTRVKQVVDTD